MDIQILNIAELLLFVFMICDCLTGTKLKMNKVDYEENGWHSPTDRFFCTHF